ncbi:MAG: protein TolA [Filomicrobium sp.]
MQAVGLIISLMLHSALLGWAAFEILGTQELPEPAAPTIEAELITVAEFTRLKQGDPEGKQLQAKKTPEQEKQVSKKEAPKPKPEPPKPPQATEPPPPETPPETKVAKLETPAPPKPDEIAEKIDSSVPPVPAPPSADEAARKKKAEIQRKYKEKKRKEAEARRKKEAERKRKLAEKKKREAEKRRKAKKKQEDFTKRMSALLDKTPEERGSKRSGTSDETDYTGPEAGERQGQGDQLTAREEDLLKGRISSQIRDCWRLPGGGGGIDVAVVKVRWRLKKNGELDGTPQVVGQRSGIVFKVAGEAAIRAVKCAAPFRLPSDMYRSWSEITWTFDPKEML